MLLCTLSSHKDGGGRLQIHTSPAIIQLLAYITASGSSAEGRQPGLLHELSGIYTHPPQNLRTGREPIWEPGRPGPCRRDTRGTSPSRLAWACVTSPAPATSCRVGFPSLDFFSNFMADCARLSAANMVHVIAERLKCTRQPVTTTVTVAPSFPRCVTRGALRQRCCANIQRCTGLLLAQQT